jgi:hypothetical protein
MLCQRVRPEQLEKIMCKNWHETHKSFNSDPWASTDLNMAEIGIHDLSDRSTPLSHCKNNACDRRVSVGIMGHYVCSHGTARKPS